MKFGVIGSNGFLGAVISKELKSVGHDVTDITRSNYEQVSSNKAFDILINAGGNSKKYVAEKTPKIDFQKNVSEIENSLLDFKFGGYYYISSIDIYHGNKDYYSIHKALAEQLIEKYADFMGFNYCNLRCGSIIGKTMVKGVLFDILHDIPLWVNKDSIFQFITAEEIAKFINYYSSMPCACDLHHNINLFSPIPIKVAEIEKIVNKPITYKTKTNLINYYIKAHNAIAYPLKSSEEYIKDVIND